VLLKHARMAMGFRLHRGSDSAVVFLPTVFPADNNLHSNIDGQNWMETS
jgi:hypothetical protein